MKYFPLIGCVCRRRNIQNEGDFVIQKPDKLQRFKTKVKKFSKNVIFLSNSIGFFQNL